MPTSFLPTFTKPALFRAKRKLSGPIPSSFPWDAAGDEKAALSPASSTAPASPAAPLDIREILGFVLFVLATVADVGAGVMVWVLFFKLVVEPDSHHTRATWGGVWALYTAAWWSFRHATRRRIDANMRSTMDHAEIFVGMSLVMVFAVNVAFWIHVPSAQPLPDLGFMLIPEQAADSPWRPLSDILTAGVPVLFVLQSALMRRENRCRVISAFFRCATVCYFLRMLTLAVTSLPGPAPHCRLGSPDYHPPTTWIDIVTRVGPIYGQYNSCGDLIFSGHMAYTNSAVLLYLRQLDRNFPRYSKLRWTLGVWYMAVLATLCIAGRKHYTVDVVLGFVVSTLVFFHFEHGWVPVCFQVADLEQLLLLQQYARSQQRRGAPHYHMWTPVKKRFSMDVTDEAADEFDDEDAGPVGRADALLAAGSVGVSGAAADAGAPAGKSLEQIQAIC